MLPIDDHLPRIRALVDRHRAVVVTAAPGAGKTTRVPPALVHAGPVLVLQPRRVAARAIARRIAVERGWALGQDVGWHVRFDRRFTPETRLILATEGVLTARLQHDPLLSDLRTVVLDEFHERSIHADLGLALVRQAWLARDDLRVVVMSATIDAGPVATYLGGCPVVEVPGRLHPLSVSYLPGATVESAVRGVMREAAGAVLCFLPGVAEIGRATRALGDLGDRVRPLHGGLDADAQDAALQPTGGPRVVLATNLAETTVTVPDVCAVVDTGLQKVARYDPDRAVDLLRTERVSQDSADQRAGRAGRTRAGVVRRLWDERDRLRPFREPEIHRVDLAGPLLDLLAWGGDPASFEWFETPAGWRVESALAVLRSLGAIDGEGRLTTDGRRMRQLPLHPRLARLLLAAGQSRPAARVCAALSEGARQPGGPPDTRDSDLDVFTDEQSLTPHQREVARRLCADGPDLEQAPIARAALAAFPDRVARRREAAGDAYLLSTGRGARLSRESGVRQAEYLVAVELTSGGRAGEDPLIRSACRIDPAWLQPTDVTRTHAIDAGGRVRATVTERYGAIVLRERAAPIDPGEAARLLAEAWEARGPDEREARWRHRARVAGIDLDLAALAGQAAAGLDRLDDLDLPACIPAHLRARIAAHAPETLQVPSGRHLRLDYHEDGRVHLAVKLQELFGLAETPRVGVPPVPVTLELLAPSGRPVQVTQDLRSFWASG